MATKTSLLQKIKHDLEILLQNIALNHIPHGSFLILLFKNLDL